MPYVPFIGPSYVYRSVNFDAQRSINLYPAKSEIGDSKTPSLMVGTPGLSLFCTLPTNGFRGAHVAKGRSFFVAGSGFYEVMADQSYVLRGTVSFSNEFVSMSDNGFQVCAVGGDNGYVFTLADNTFSQIVSDGWFGADTVSFLDGFGVFNKPKTNQYYVSSPYDFSALDVLDFASVESNPNNIVAVATVHQNIWCLGTDSIEIEYPSGDADFPFTRVQGAFIEYGCVAAGTVVNSANTLFWLGADQNGAGIVWMASGYDPQRISTSAIENYLQQYNADLSLATAYTYQEEGHFFYLLNVPGMPTTVVFDVTEKQWHERAYFNTTTGQYERQLGQCHAYAFGKHLIGDYRTGNIYVQDLNYTTDNGALIRRERIAPHMINNLDYLFFESFQLDMQTGIGLDGSPGIQDTDPMIMLSWSNDGGHTWSDEDWRSAGKIGEYTERALWRQLGRSRDRVWKAAFTGKCTVAWLGSVVKAKGGYS